MGIGEELAKHAGYEWPTPQVREATTSTNADVTVLANAGAPVGTCVIADEQLAGRGRLGRTWVSPPGSGLWMSVLVAPDRPLRDWGWLPLIAGIAACRGIRNTAGVEVFLKWPNDVMSNDGYKLGGILVENLDHGRAVVGIGINISMEELPTELSTTIHRIGGNVDRDVLAAAILSELHNLLLEWADRSLADEYRSLSMTIGMPVRVVRAGHDDLLGTATNIDEDGRLVVDEHTRISAGDVTHLMV